MGQCSRPHLLIAVSLLFVLLSAANGILAAGPVLTQAESPAWLDEAARLTGLSRQELLRRYAAAREAESGTAADSVAALPPGRQNLEEIDDRRPREYMPDVILPFDLEAPSQPDSVAATAPRMTDDNADSNSVFGTDFFLLDEDLFQPPSFGPVPDDYLIGVGDQIVVDVWGEVEFRVERIVDREGTVIIPRCGQMPCANRTLAEVRRSIRQCMSRSYSGISERPGEGSTDLTVTLGRLRAIRIFVVGDAERPGAYELSSVATVFTALYAAGGPSSRGSMRGIRLERGGETVATLDVYQYLMAGKRLGDAALRDGDTVFIPARGKTVRLSGDVSRPRIYELKDNEDLADLLRFGEGFRPTAAMEIVHIERILPAMTRQPHLPDRILMDVPLDLETLQPKDRETAKLFDGDIVRIGTIAERMGRWVEIHGNVKRPGRFEFREGMDVAELIALAGGLWADTLEERALIDRVAADGRYLSFSFSLLDIYAGKATPPVLQQRDNVIVFSKWDVQDRFPVSISGEVRRPGSFPFREGMTLLDLILKAGGLKESADVLRVEVSRLRLAAVESRDVSEPPSTFVDIIDLSLGRDYLADGRNFILQPHDHVAIRQLPWWELQRNVTVRGAVYYPGVYSLSKRDERLSEVITRSGGLMSTAFAAGARIIRVQDDVGNIALDLGKALENPGSAYDIILKSGDEIRVPEIPHTVKVIGAVGFPTSIVFEKGKGPGFYVERAGGYGENADKWKTRVVYPNGMSRPIKRVWRDPRVMAGSTIVVPFKSRGEGSVKMETIKDIAAIFASLATVYLVIDRTGN